MAKTTGRRWDVRDRTTLAIGAAFLTLLLAAMFPRCVPAARRGPQCTDLASPLGGNNRSILAQTGGKEDAVELDLSVENNAINVGDPLRVHLTFVNQDIGPVILYLTEREPILSRQNLTSGAPRPGITFEVTRVNDNITLIDQTEPPVPQPPFDYDNLHLLGSRSRCTENYTISGTRLSQLGLQPGEYRIRAYYRHDNAGILPQPPFGVPTATAAYTDQGVWIGDTGSNEVRFTVNVPQAAVPAQ